MAVKSSGSLSFTEIKNEFGFPPDKKFGNYRISETVGAMTNLPLDTGIPQSGAIKFSDFYGKKQNIIVDLFSGGTEQSVDAKSIFNSNKVVVLGGGSKPTNTGDKKVIVHVNKLVQSQKSPDNKRVALLTGNWDNGTDFTINVGSAGTISGTGGNGGSGANAGNNRGTDGEGGTSAIGVNDSDLVVKIQNNGLIRTGFGGGGGGAGRGESRKSGKKSSIWCTSSGGGGGGGLGYPIGAGLGGSSPTDASNGTNGNAGGNGQQNIAGGFGAGGQNASAGGNGGDTTSGATAARAPSGGTNGSIVATLGGVNGYALVRVSGSTVNISGNSIVGREVVGTPFR